MDRIESEELTKDQRRALARLVNTLTATPEEEEKYGTAALWRCGQKSLQELMIAFEGEK